MRPSTDLSRQSYRCGTSGFRGLRPQRQPPSRLRNHYGFASPSHPASQSARVHSTSENPGFRKEDQQRRSKAEPVATRISSILGIFPVLAYLFSHTTVLAGPAALFILVGGWAVGAFLSYIVSLLVLDRFCPWKKLVITAEFDGILPKEAREKARAAAEHFDNLYLVVDQQHRWKSTFLPDPRPRALDPLLIGELRHGRRYQFFLIDQFDLTQAERYLTDEFAAVTA